MAEETTTEINHKRKINNNQKKRECTTSSQPSKKKKGKEVAVFGNYRNYYGYRVDQWLEEDPRLKAMKKEWFEGKDCLDIGCNSGLMTISVAKKFGCRTILGVDIDGARVEDAYWTLRKVVKTNPRKMSSNIHSSYGSASENHGSHSSLEEAGPNSGDSSLEEAKDLLNIVSFQKGNFVQNWHPPENTRYYAILCLSVSKWIHLNWGDDGLITLFRKAWQLLQPGGVFILEPQPWKSYNSNRLVSETTAANYKIIEIPPHDFQDILLDKIGFRRVENLTPGLSGTKSGFDRPILAFWK